MLNHILMAAAGLCVAYLAGRKLCGVCYFAAQKHWRELLEERRRYGSMDPAEFRQRMLGELTERIDDERRSLALLEQGGPGVWSGFDADSSTNLDYEVGLAAARHRLLQDERLLERWRACAPEAAKNDFLNGLRRDLKSAAVTVHRLGRLLRRTSFAAN